MTAPATTWKTPTRHTRRLRLPRLGWGWLVVVIIAIGIARTWPLWTALTIAILATALVVRRVRPRSLNRLWYALDHAAARRPALPAPGRRTLNHFHRLTPTGFEQAITELALEHPHVHTATHVGQANDRGADVLVHLKDGRRILIQCKHYKPGNNVSSETVQTINGVYRDIHHCHAAAIVTTASFTRPALETNARLPYGIRLINGDALVAWANGGPAPWDH